MDDWRATYEHSETPLHRTGLSSSLKLCHLPWTGRVENDDVDHVAYFTTTRLYSKNTRPEEQVIRDTVRHQELLDQNEGEHNRWVPNPNQTTQRKRERTIEQAVCLISYFHLINF